MDNKKEVIIQHISVMGPKTVGNEIYLLEVYLVVYYL